MCTTILVISTLVIMLRRHFSNRVEPDAKTPLLQGHDSFSKQPYAPVAQRRKKGPLFFLSNECQAAIHFLSCISSN
uniref:Uncharacterized protein n=1 Tax=Crocodylus porosus TaxID=8502 RepID=A0A7M4EHW0_CROPO